MRTIIDAVATLAAAVCVAFLFPLGILLIGLPVVLFVRLLLEIVRRF